MLAEPLLKPYPKSFPDLLVDYCEQIAGAKAKNVHHDQRRALFMDFLRKGFFVEAQEVELEHKVKVAQVRGFIDALYHTTIFEFKTDMERERAAGLSEIRTYLQSRSGPEDYITVLTDGEVFESYQWNEGDIERIDSFRLLAGKPLEAYLKIDQFCTSEKPRQPTSSDIVVSFGPFSAVYRKAASLMKTLYERVSHVPSVLTKMREWNRLLAKVYGSELGYADLFVTHTYLVVLSRLMVAQALFPREARNTEAYRGLMSGGYFVRKNLPNLAEPDFFSWALDTPGEQDFLGLLGRLEKHVGKFKFGSTSEDILKELYQELVDPADRHDLGEYYTPDWLAELTLDRIGYQGGTLLDPSCGSGTFLMAAVRRLRAAGLAKRNLVEAVSRDLAGIDIHPLAVLMAKANLLLALGADARGHVGQIRLPVFMADTLQTELDESRGFLKIPAAAKRVFHLPLASIDRSTEELDAMVEEMQHFAEIAAEPGGDLVAAKAGLMKKFPFHHDEAFLWRQNLEVATKLMRDKKNSIWAFILKNAYRPVFIRRRKVEYVVGNPPWLSYRYIKDPDYKTRVREIATDLGLVARKSAHLLTQLDLSTIFYRHCEKDFLAKGGKMGMVLPRSVIIGAKQHAAFQQQGGFSMILDCEGVQHLFNVPACVLLKLEHAVKGDAIPCEVFSGSLQTRNQSWDRAKKSLFVHKATHEFVTHEIRSPWYRDRALQGATLVPRAFWFVELDPKASPNPQVPYLRTAEETLNEAKDLWKKHKVSLSGQIESPFLFFTVLAKGLIPFGICRREPVFLPIRKNRDGSVGVVDASELLAEGLRCASSWLLNAEKLWLKHRSKGNTRSLAQWINYHGKLASQNLAQKHVVIFNASGTNLTAACVDTSPGQVVNEIPTNGFIADAKTYYLYLDSRDHADYLCAVLNSEKVMEAVKATMPRGLMGERDIHRRPFEVCEIPRFDPNIKLHLDIAALGEKCRKKAAKVAEKMTGRLGRVRQDMRLYLDLEIGEINRLVAHLLKQQSARPKKRSLIPPPSELSLF
jgi:hypothetical protein